MSYRGAWIGVVLLAATSSGAVDGAPLAVSAGVSFADGVQVLVTVDNATGETLAAVRPEIRYRLTERLGDPTALPPGARHQWRVSFPPPAGPSGDPLIVLVRWQDAAGRPRSFPYAQSLETPGLLPTEAQVMLETEPTAGHERALVRITNATADPLRARLVALIPEEFFTTPVAQAVEVPPRTSVAVPIDVQSHGPPGTVYPLHAIVQFVQAGIPRALVARTELGIGVTPSRAWLPPVAVGGAALVCAVAVVIAAHRSARRRLHVDGGGRHT